MNLIGDIGLSLAVLFAAAAVLASLIAVRFDSARALLAARLSVAAVASMFLVSAAVLVGCLLQSDFTITYVARFTERALPLGYKLAAFWAGQEGSLLLWAVLLAAMSTLAVFTLNRRQSIGQSAGVITTLAVVCGFFGLLILFAADPFAISATAPADGNGLNPMLQDKGMIAHPPMLFLGYAGFTIPFALMVGALLVGQRDDLWIAAARRWSLAAWLFLSVGILLGAQWAYVELGWGGYWAWDPVENASLLPWLTATAFLHSLMVQQHRGSFRIWNTVLLAVTFILCIFGTYLTRSGLVDSVHSFGQSLVGNFFLAFLLITALFCAGLIAFRIKSLRTSHKLEGLLGREGAFLAANVLLSGITLVVLIGTIFPAISGGITGTRTTLGASFYNTVFGPVAMLLLALMATGPLQVYGRDAARRLKNGSVVPTVVSLFAGAIIWVIGFHNAWAVACAAISAAAVTVIVIDLFRAVITRSRHENPLLALPRLLWSNHRRYGAQLAHLGIVMIVIGVTGSSVFSQKKTFQVNPGGSTNFAGTLVTLNTINQSQGPNYTKVEASLTVVDSAGRATTLMPQRRFYNKWEDQPASVVAIESTRKRDLYVNLAGWDPDGKNVALELISNPLVSWLWIGGWVVAIGGLICLMPRFGLLFHGNQREIPMKATRPAIATTVATIACVLAIISASLPARAGAQTAPPNLPPGHPDLSQLQGGDAGALPPGHPGVGAATTQPTAAVTIQAVQKTSGGPAVAGDSLTIELYCRGQLFDQTITQLGPAGALKLTGLPSQYQLQPVAKVKHAGVVYSAAGVTIDAEHLAQDLQVPVYETTTVAPAWSVTMRHVIIHPTPTGIDVMEMFALAVPGDRAWTGSTDATTLSLPLSADATGVKVGGDLDESAIKIVDGKLISHQPLTPGENRYQLQYTVPAKNGQAVLSIVAPAKVGHVMVFVPDDGTTVTAAGLQAMGSEQMDNSGTKTRYYMATSLEAGQTVTLTVSGLKTAAAPDVNPQAGAADEPVEANMVGSGIPKAIAAIGGLAILCIGVLVVLVKTPATAKAKAKTANHGHGHDRR